MLDIYYRQAPCFFGVAASVYQPMPLINGRYVSARYHRRRAGSSAFGIFRV
jgi:hypothetical protein